MSTTTHPVAPEEVMASLDGELSPDRSSTVSAHLKDCPECHEVAESFSKTSQSLCDWTVAAASPSLDDYVLRASTHVTKPMDNNPFSALRRFLRRRPSLAWGGAAFAALLIFLGLNSVRYDLSRPKSIREVRRRVAEQQAARGQDSLGKLETPGIADEGDSQYFVRRIPFPPASPTPADRVSGGGDAVPLEERGRNPVPQALALPMIARTASLSIVVKDFDSGRAALDTILARYNGYAAGLNVNTPQGSARTLQASLRIPSQQLSAAVAELKALGRVEAETQSGEEVTQQHADLVARIKNNRETEVRLQGILRTRTGKVKDVLEVENEIARVRGEIEQMEAEQQTLEHRVDFATIDLRLAEEYKAQLNPPAPSVTTQLRNACVTGFRAALESLLALVLFLAESGPTLLLWALILCFPAWLLWRRYRRSFAMVSNLGA